jgi:hypothetical protein
VHRPSHHNADEHPKIGLQAERREHLQNQRRSTPGGAAGFAGEQFY